MLPLHCSSYVVVLVIMQPWPLHKTCRLQTRFTTTLLESHLKLVRLFSDSTPSAKHSNSLSQPTPAIMS